MKTNLSFALRTVVFLATTAAVVAAPLTVTTAVHTKPDTLAPTLTVLNAGTEPVAATGTVGTTPAGWMAVELPGPFTGYVEKKDFTKALDVKPGVAIRLAPKADASVLAIAEKGDVTEITGVASGRWNQITLQKKMIGYIHLGGSAGYTPPIATAPAGSGAMSPAPISPQAYGVTTPGQAAPMVNLGDGGAALLPRQFVGKFVSTRRPLAPRRPFDWALNDDAGKRYAYLDVSKLLLTDQIEKFADHAVVVYGVVKTAPGGKDLLIQVESMQLK